MKERWLPIDGCGGLYKASSHGRIWSKPRMRTKGGILKTTIGPNGYPVANIYYDGVKRTRCVHVVILETFSGPRPNGMECRHLDGTKTNNRIDNLTWGTPKENSDDQRRHGTLVNGERHGISKLTESQVKKILAMTGTHESIALEFNVNRSLVSQIKRREIWRHVT